MLKIEGYMSDVFIKYQLDKKIYSEIINYAFSEDFINLNKLSNIERYENGMCKKPYIVLYYNNKSFITNGNNNKEKFNKLVKMLEEL